MTKKEVISVLKVLINVLETEINVLETKTIAQPLQEAFNAFKEIENTFLNYKKEKNERVEALKIAVEILEDISEQRFTRGKKCRLN